ncbi:S1/P1 nuclease [Hymenobacter sp. YC55]|uniref:S1/P1 nuclease n=1 Tax=Hymenobacter sp. YC55 TaxID=3034019 RepID=UPI0023F6A0FE|nr:S1/P1 nuclease [Hymenobacter sp. YC55]MDF7813987.1 S1/P1 nuclease [Hymenobacter sp. YC55]
MLKKYCLLALFFGLPFAGFAWGVVGHRAIGKVADNHLNGKARREITRLLGHETLALVSTYPDEIRPYPDFAYTSPWHYVNTAVGLTQPQYESQLKSITEPTAYNSLLTQIKTLRDPAATREQKVFALKFVVHIIGDVHQPLHTGTAETRGGNKILVKFRGKDTNLHGLWDSGLIDYTGLTYLELAATVDHADRTQIRQWQQDEPATWLYESYQLSQPLAVEAQQQPELDYRYYPKYAAVMEQRLLQAGIRLAGVLNDVFS